MWLKQRKILTIAGVLCIIVVFHIQACRGPVLPGAKRAHLRHPAVSKVQCKVHYFTVQAQNKRVRVSFRQDATSQSSGGFYTWYSQNDPPPPNPTLLHISLLIVNDTNACLWCVIQLLTAVRLIGVCLIPDGPLMCPLSQDGACPDLNPQECLITQY